MLTMTTSVRKFALTAHVTSSVGWLGAVAAFLAVSIAGLVSQDAQMVRAAYLSMELTGWFVIVPLSLASLLTGLVQSLGTTWGLFRHYWVLAKLLITVVATLVLLVHMQPVSQIAAVAATTTLSSADLRGLRIQLVADAGAALLVLLVATTLSVYKPQGRTPYGRKQRERLYSELERDTSLGTFNVNEVVPGSRRLTSTPRWVYIAGIIIIVLLLLFVIQHLANGGFAGHAAHGAVLR